MHIKLGGAATTPQYTSDTHMHRQGAGQSAIALPHTIPPTPPSSSPLLLPPPPPPPLPGWVSMWHPVSLSCANIMAGHYRYTSDLLQLASTTLSHPTTPWPQYRSPVRVDLLQPFLDSHPDQPFATYIQEGLLHGFRVGFNHNQPNLQSSRRNHPSARNRPHVVSEKLASEVAAGRTTRPNCS